MLLNEVILCTIKSYFLFYSVSVWRAAQLASGLVQAPKYLFYLHHPVQLLFT